MPSRYVGAEGATKVAPRVPGMGRLVTCKEVTGESDDNRSEAQGGSREAKLKEAWIKGTTVGTRTSSEAGCGR